MGGQMWLFTKERIKFVFSVFLTIFASLVEEWLYY